MDAIIKVTSELEWWNGGMSYWTQHLSIRISLNEQFMKWYKCTVYLQSKYQIVYYIIDKIFVKKSQVQYKFYFTTPAVQ